jgi:hypothetical protein
MLSDDLDHVFKAMKYSGQDLFDYISFVAFLFFSAIFSGSFDHHPSRK